MGVSIKWSCFNLRLPCPHCCHSPTAQFPSSASWTDAAFPVVCTLQWASCRILNMLLPSAAFISTNWHLDFHSRIQTWFPPAQGCSLSSVFLDNETQSLAIFFVSQSLSSTVLSPWPSWGVCIVRNLPSLAVCLLLGSLPSLAVCLPSVPCPLLMCACH